MPPQISELPLFPQKSSVVIHKCAVQTPHLLSAVVPDCSRLLALRFRSFFSLLCALIPRYVCHVTGVKHKSKLVTRPQLGGSGTARSLLVQRSRLIHSGKRSRRAPLDFPAKQPTHHRGSYPLRRFPSLLLAELPFRRYGRGLWLT